MNEPSYSDHPSIEPMESLDSHSTDSYTQKVKVTWELLSKKEMVPGIN